MPKFEVRLIYIVEADDPRTAIDNVMNNKDREPIGIYSDKPED